MFHSYFPPCIFADFFFFAIGGVLVDTAFLDMSATAGGSIRSLPLVLGLVCGLATVYTWGWWHRKKSVDQELEKGKRLEVIRLNGNPVGGLQPILDTVPLNSFTTADTTQLNHTFFASSDLSTLCGVWECAPNREVFESYPVHEMMYVISGSVTLTDLSTARRQTFTAGDHFFIAKGTACMWEITETLRKYYMISEYSEQAAIPVSTACAALASDAFNNPHITTIRQYYEAMNTHDLSLILPYLAQDVQVTFNDTSRNWQGMENARHKFGLMYERNPLFCAALVSVELVPPFTGDGKKEREGGVRLSVVAKFGSTDMIASAGKEGAHETRMLYTMAADGAQITAIHHV